MFQCEISHAFPEKLYLKHYSFRPKTKVERGSVHYMAAGCKAFLKLNRSQKKIREVDGIVSSPYDVKPKRRRRNKHKQKIRIILHSRTTAHHKGDAYRIIKECERCWGSAASEKLERKVAQEERKIEQASQKLQKNNGSKQHSQSNPANRTWLSAYS